MTESYGVISYERAGTEPYEHAGAEGPLLVTVQSEAERGAGLGFHHHPHHIVAWSVTATASMRTEARDWLVPPTHGMWLPAGTSHTVEVLRPGRVCAVLLDAARCPTAWPEPTGVLITPLVRELIIHLDGCPDDRPPVRTHAETLLLDLLEPAPSTHLPVPLPHDPRARMIADALIADPAEGRDLAAWARYANAGVRTVTRLFTDQTGMTFARWRTHVRVRAALTHLARGRSVGATARAVGYRKPGAFSDAFQRVTGQHPGVYGTR